MKFHLIQPGMIGRKTDIEKGMAGQNKELYQRYLEEIRGYIRLADELGFASYGHNEHHLQIEGFEITNHPGMFSLFVGLHSKRVKVATLGYVLPTHNPVRAAEEIATLDHMLKGRLLVGFTRGYQSRWVGSYAAVPGVNATTPDLAKSRDEVDTMNREIFEESLQIVKKAWLNSTFSYEGKYWQFPPKSGLTGHPAYEKYGAGMGEDGMVHEIGIAPRPYQVPHPPLYGAFAHGMRTIDMWAREGGKPIVMANQMEFCEALWDRYIKKAGEAGRDVKREDAAAWGGVLMLGDNPERLAEIKADHDWYWNAFFLPFGQGYANCLIGNADRVSRQIEDAQKRLGFTEMWVQFGQATWIRRRTLRNSTSSPTRSSPASPTRPKTGHGSDQARIDESPVPVVARVNGAAIGAGLAIAVAVDVAAEDAFFVLPEVRLGLVPGPAAAACLARMGQTREARGRR